MYRLLLFFAFAGLACSSAPKKPVHIAPPHDSLPADTPAEKHPMMLRISMQDFVNGFADIPFPFHDSLLKARRIKSFSFTESVLSDGKWLDDRNTKSWQFNTEGQPVEYLFTEEKGTKNIHRQTFTYRNGLLTESAFTNYLWGEKPDITRYSYSGGKLVRSTTTDPLNRVTGELAYSYSGDQLKSVKDWRNGDEYLYSYTDGRLTGVTVPARKWEKTYTYNSAGWPVDARSVTDYTDHYTFLYNASEQLEQIHWEEDEKPLADIYFEFDKDGLIRTIRHVGHVAAMNEERKLVFTYTFYP